MTAESVTVAPARLPSAAAVPGRKLTAAKFRELLQVWPAAEWFANIDNPNTRRSYRNDLKEFMTFIGIEEAIDDLLDKYRRKALERKR